ncbi:MAG: ABC transporter ATP-binding protein [Bacteroidales bacterium]|nr:ABC transporter ATP-binding protein [Bacteroidales bacterium]
MINIIDIKKSYGDLNVLESVNLNCENGKIQALLGANGAGKSTLINIISGLIKRDGGKISIDNEFIEIKKYKYRSKVGYVFETPIYIESLSVIDYLTFVAKMYGIPKNDYLIRIKDLVDFFNFPCNSKMHIKKYSKGMKSKISIAAAIIHNPKYLILDEPFDGLDFLSIQKITKLFRTLAEKGCTILITSHQYDVIANLCDKFALLKNGSIIFNYSLQELEKVAKEYSNEPDPVKHYLEKMMDDNPSDKKSLSWIE